MQIQDIRVFQRSAMCTKDRCRMGSAYYYVLVSECAACRGYKEHRIPKHKLTQYRPHVRYVRREDPCMICRGHQFVCNNVIMYSLTCSCGSAGEADRQ